MALHLLLTLAAGACLAIDGDRILMSDLAAAIPAFSAAEGSESIGFAPFPGSQRRFSAGEVSRLAAGRKIATEPEPVCFERKLETLTPERLLAALREALPANAQVELIDFSHVRIPHGRLEFPGDGFVSRPGGSPHGAAIWRGRVKYAVAQSIPVWALTRVWVSRTAVVAARDLPPERPIEAGDTHVMTVDIGPFSEVPLSSPEEVAGLAPRRMIRAGQPIPRSLLETPPEVSRGEMVGIEARYGAAFLKFEVHAEASGRVGDSIQVRNVESGKIFRARVVRKGWVAVE
jgi:flagella basal body P-ring formation protein FlgA